MLWWPQDLVEELSKQQWYADRKGENPPGKKQYYQLPIFNYFKVCVCPASATPLMCCTPACPGTQDPSSCDAIPALSHGSLLPQRKHCPIDGRACPEHAQLAYML